MVINNRAVKVHLLFKLKYAILLFSDMILQRFDCSPQGIYELRFSLLLPCSVGTLVACVVLVHLAHDCSNQGHSVHDTDRSTSTPVAADRLAMIANEQISDGCNMSEYVGGCTIAVTFADN